MEEKYFKKSGGMNSDMPRAPKQSKFMSEHQQKSEISNETHGGGTQMMSMGKSIAMAQRKTNYTDGPQIEKRNNELISA